jgi:hypothetical protein
VYFEIIGHQPVLLSGILTSLRHIRDCLTQLKAALSGREKRKRLSFVESVNNVLICTHCMMECNALMKKSSLIGASTTKSLDIAAPVNGVSMSAKLT